MKVDLKFSSILAEDYLEEKIEHEPTVGTLIIQFQESTTKPDVQITNVTEKEVKICIKFRKKFTRIATRKIM